MFIFILWWENKAFFNLFFSDRGGLHPIPKCPWGRMMMCSVSLRQHFHTQFLSCSEMTLTFLNPCYCDRCWAEKVPFLSSSCRSLEVTGLKGLTMTWVTRQKQSSCGLRPPTPAPSWNVTQQLHSSGNTSWARWDTLSRLIQAIPLESIWNWCNCGGKTKVSYKKLLGPH